MNAKSVIAQISNGATKLGDLRKMAKDLKKNHELALELWSSGNFMARQLALLIMDNKLFSQTVIDILNKDMMQHKEEEKLQLMD